MAVERHERALHAVLPERALDPTRLAFLAAAGAVLSSSLDYEATLQRVAELAVPELADWCVVDLVAEHGGVRRVAVVCADPANGRLAAELREGYPQQPDRPQGTAGVLRTGRPELVAEVSDEWLAAIAPDEEQLAILRRLGLRSNLIVPLIARGRTIGALTLATAESGRTYGQADVVLAEELAARAAMAVDNARLFRDSEQSLAVLDTLLATAPVGLAFWDRSLRYVRINDTLAALNGPTPEEHIGRTVHEVLPDVADEITGYLRGVLETGRPILNQEITGETPAAPGEQRHWLASYYPVQAIGGETLGIGAVVSEITERRRGERRLATQHAATRILADSPSLEDAAPRLLRAVGEALEWELGSLWLVDDEGETIRCSEVWYAAHVEIGRFERLSRRLALPRGVGLPGRVWRTGVPAWIEDVTRDPNFPRIAAASEIGVHSALAFPIVMSGSVLGVMEFFTERVQRPDNDLLSAMWVVGGQIGQFVERKRAEQERLRLLAREHVARAEAEEARRRVAFLAEASAVLASSLDYETNLGRMARLVVPGLADWCVVHIAEDDRLRRLASAHVDPSKVRWAEELAARYPTDPEAELGPAQVLRTGEPELVSEIPDEMLATVAQDEEHLRLLREFGMKSYICVPLTARGRTLGTLTFISAESGHRYVDGDAGLVVELARRAALAVDNARLYRVVEERAQAARVLTYVGDGVFLLDRTGVVRLWNPAAEAITGLRAYDMVGRRAANAIPGWGDAAKLVPVAVAPAPVGRAATVPLDLPDRSLWLSISGVGFEEGTVYAFRDLTEERAVEKMKTDFVSTISHELRTPLAAIYGSALTLGRDDVTLGEDRRNALLGVIVDEADRLANIVSDVLLASRIDSGYLPFAITRLDSGDVVRSAVDVARLHAPSAIDFVVSDCAGYVDADPEKLRQVLTNLMDNAAKYSPEGGTVQVSCSLVGDRIRFFVRDEGIGIPPSERERIFEKFYRLDPELTRGVGGTGLGLYICRELVERMDGSIWVEAGSDGAGSTFVVDLPAAGRDAPTARSA